MPGTISAPPVPRIPPNYEQTRNPEERGMETTDQYLLRIQELTPVERGIWYPNGEYLEPGMISELLPQWEETTDQYLLRISALGDPATDTALAVGGVIAFFLLMGNLKKGNPIRGK